MDRELKVKISEICSLLDVDGIRGDITTNKAARALAAYQSQDTVTLEHVQAVIGLCLNHRCALCMRSLIVEECLGIMVLCERSKALAGHPAVPQCCASCEGMEACASACILHGSHETHSCIGLRYAAQKSVDLCTGTHVPTDQGHHGSLRA